MSTRIEQSNIFEQTTTTSSTEAAEPSNLETTAAGKLIAHLKWIADEMIRSAGNRANWLALAANQGQNVDPGSFVKKEQVKPTALTRAGALAPWTLPAIAATPLQLPAIPDNLKIDFARLGQETLADITNLQTSWMAHYLPDSADVSSLGRLIDDVLGGTQDSSARTRLDGLEAETHAALQAIIDATLTRMNTAIDLARTNLTANSTTAKVGVADALTLANDNTREIAWVRARDQAAREAARNEAAGAAAWANRGFSLPGGALVSMGMKARQATLDAASEMAAKEAEKAQTMYFDVAKAHIDTWLRTMDAQSNSEISAYKAVVETNLRFAEIQLDANKTKAKQAFDHLGLRLDFTKFAAGEAARYRLGVIAGMNDLIRAYGSLRGNETEYLNSDRKSVV